MNDDPIVEETRKIRNKIAAQYNYNIYELGEYFQKQQTLSKRDIVTRAPKLITRRKETM